MITGLYQWLVQSQKYTLPIVVDRTGFTMHDFRGTNNSSSKCLSNRLVTQTDPKDWHFSCKELDDLQANSCLIGIARPWTNHDVIWVQFNQLRQCCLIISNRGHGLTQLAKILDQVVGEAIVIVDHQ